jgi:hypothetical protein
MMNRGNLKTIEGVLETLYRVISGKKGEVRDWDLFKNLFYPRAKLIYYGADVEGVIRAQYWTPDFYIKTVGKHQETELDTDFFEREIHRVTNTFGNIAHVFSTYAAFHDKLDKKPYTRGINSIQLLNHKGRWWIINLYWNGIEETPDNPIQKEYLP